MYRAAGRIPPIRITVLLTSFIRLSMPENEFPTALYFGKKRLPEMTRRRTSNPLVNSVIFLEYSLSDTRTLFSICSVFVWISFRTDINLSTASSNDRMKGFGSKADSMDVMILVFGGKSLTYGHCQLLNLLLVSQKQIRRIL